MSFVKKSVSLLLAVILVMTVLTVGVVPTAPKASAASWNGYNYGGGTLYGYQTILEAYGIDYDVYMKWLDDHDADSDNPRYYLGTPYVGEDHRNPHGDCDGAYGYYDTPGVEGMNCTGFVWHVLYKAAVHSGAPSYKINRLGVMGGVLSSWYSYGVYRIWFDSLEDAYDSGVLEKGDVMWIYGTSDNHNAIFYGDSPEDFIYWDSAGERNRYCEVHAIGDCRGLWVAKVTQPYNIELHIDTPSGGSGTKFGTKYMIFDSEAKAQAALDHPDDMSAWDKREGTIVLNSSGHGVYRTQSAPSASELWTGSIPRTGHSYFNSDAERVSNRNTWYAVQWSHSPGISEDETIHVFKDSGYRTASGYPIYRFYAPIKVDTPSITSMKSISDGVRIKWGAVKDAYKYRVYYRNNTGGWTRMAETASTTYLDDDVRSGKTYNYTVRCVDKYGNFISEHNKTGWTHTYTKAATPEITELSSTPQGVNITWKPVEGVEKYRVYFKNSSGGWTRMAETSDASYLDEAITNGGTYTYTVRCVDKEGDFISDYNKTGWKYTYTGVDTPQIETLKSEPDGVRLNWNTVDGAAKYRVYCLKADGSWARIAETADTEYLDDVVTAGNSYTYTVRCVNSKGYFISDYNKNGWKTTFDGVATPEITELTSKADGVHLSWNAVEGAAKYRVYYKNAKGGWTRFAETSGTSCVDDVVALNTEYIYTVRCVNAKGSFTSDYNKNGWAYTYTGVNAPETLTLESAADGIRISWNAVEDVPQYQTYYLGAGDVWKPLTLTDTTSVTDTDVTPGWHYSYAVRCVGPRGNVISDYKSSGERIEYIVPTDPTEPVNPE